MTKAIAVPGSASSDPLARLDEPMGVKQASRAVGFAEATAGEAREELLGKCISAGEAVRLTERSRQSLEGLRRKRRVLALCEGNRWRYPRWQFDRAGPWGIVPGLERVLAALNSSAAGAAYWLTRRHKRLGASPIELLHRRRFDPVLEAAREQGERP